jgi:hypothetical protein
MAKVFPGGGDGAIAVFVGIMGHFHYPSGPQTRPAGTYYSEH